MKWKITHGGITAFQYFPRCILFTCSFFFFNRLHASYILKILMSYTYFIQILIASACLFRTKENNVNFSSLLFSYFNISDCFNLFWRIYSSFDLNHNFSNNILHPSIFASLTYNSILTFHQDYFTELSHHIFFPLHWFSLNPLFISAPLTSREVLSTTYQ